MRTEARLRIAAVLAAIYLVLFLLWVRTAGAQGLPAATTVYVEATTNDSGIYNDAVHAALTRYGAAKNVVEDKTEAQYTIRFSVARILASGRAVELARVYCSLRDNAAKRSVWLYIATGRPYEDAAAVIDSSIKYLVISICNGDLLPAKGKGADK